MYVTCRIYLTIIRFFPTPYSPWIWHLKQILMWRAAVDCGCSFVVEPGAFVDVKIALRLRIADPDKTNEWLINLCYVSWEQINKTLETEGKPGRSGDKIIWLSYSGTQEVWYQKEFNRNYLEGKPEVICIQETWLKLIIDFVIKEYHSIRRYRQQGKEGFL